MISMLAWRLRRTLLWIFILLSSTFYPVFCNMDQDESVTATTDEVGNVPIFVQDDPQEEKEAPISGFDFYSKEDYGENWWDDLRLNNEDELQNFPSVQDQRINAAVNVKQSDSSNFINSGHVGSNMIHDIADSTVNTGTFSTNRMFFDTIFQQARPWREISRRDMAEKYTDFLGEIQSRTPQPYDAHPEVYFPQKQWRTMNSAANLDLGPTITFGNRGKIGSNKEVIRNPAILRYQNLYHPESYSSYLRSENLNSAANLKAGYESKFVNHGDIGSNLIYSIARDSNTNKIRSELPLPQKQWRTMNSAANLDLGPASTFGNRGKIGSNIEVIRKPAIMRSQSQYYPDLLLNYPSNLRSKNLNAAANIKAGYGGKFANEGDIGSNLIYNVARDTYTNKINAGSHFPQKQWRTMNAAANIDLGPATIFGNRGKIGSNIKVITKPTVLRSQSLYYPKLLLSYPSNSRSQNFNAAANIKAGYGTKFANEGDIGSNLIYNVARDTNTNKIRSGLPLPLKQWRKMNSAANLDLGPASTFGNRGKIGSNIAVIRKPTIMRPQSLYYPDLFLSYPSNLRSEKLNAAANIKAGYGSKFFNEGDIGSNLIYNVARHIYTNKIDIDEPLPLKQRRTMNSAANLDLGPGSTFGNRGKIGSNIKLITKPAILRSQIPYYPDLLLSYPSNFWPEKLKAAANIRADYRSKFVNEGDIGSNLIYNVAQGTNGNKIRSGLPLPLKQWRTMNAAANLDLGSATTFGNRGKIGSNIEVIRKPAILRSQSLYYPDLLQSYPSNLRSENVNAATNLKAGYGTKFVNEGDIGSSLIYNAAQDSYANKIYAGALFPRKQWRTMNSVANLDLGPTSRFGNRGKIGSNIEVITNPAILRSQSLYYPDLLLRHPSNLRSENLNAATNINTGYGAKFVNEGDIGSNLIYNVAHDTKSNKIRSGLPLPLKHWRTMNSAANLDLGSASTFGNRGKIGSNVEVIRKPTIMGSQSLYYPDLLLSYPSNLRSENINAAANIKAGYGSKFVNEGDIGSNLIYNVAQDTNGNKIRSGLSLPQKQWRTMNAAANLDLGPESTFGNRGKIGSNIKVIRKPAIMRSQNLYYPDLLLSDPSNLRSKNLNAASNINAGYGAKFVNEGDIALNLIYNVARDTNTNKIRSGLPLPLKQWRSMNSAANLDLGPASTFGNKGKIGSNVEIIRKPAILRSRNLYYPDLVLSYPSSLWSEKLNAAANLNTGHESKFVSDGEIGSNLIYIVERDTNANNVPAALTFPQRQWRTMNSAENLYLSPMPTFGYSGELGSNIDIIMRPAILRSQNLHYLDLLVGYPSSIRTENMNSAANLNTGYGSTFINEGEVGSNLPYHVVRTINDDGMRRNTDAKSAQRFVSNCNQPSCRSLYKSQWALRTAENDANKKGSKGKGMVNIFMESGSLFDNQGAIGNEQYDMHSLPLEIKLRGPVTSYAYVIPPSGKGRSALSGGTVVTGISTKTLIEQPKFDINNNYNRNLKQAFQERSSLINDGTISASEILFSRGSAIASNGTKMQMPNSSPAAVSFGKLGLDMAHSSNKASIVAGDNAQIFINGKMGTYQVSIPIGSIVASEGSGVSLRTSNPYWSGLFSETSQLDLKSPLSFFTNLYSVITGVVKVTSIDSQGREKIVVCELENPITAVEIGRPPPASQVLLQLLYITKLRVNLANLLSYLTAVSATKYDESLYVSLQILYNAVQYRQMNVLPLLLVKTSYLPPKLHFRGMLEILQNVAPISVRYAVKALIEDVKKQNDKYVGISENLISFLTDTLNLDMIPNIAAELQRDIILGELGEFVTQVVEKAFSQIRYVKSARDIKDIVYLTMLNLPLSYSVPQLPIKLRLVAQMLFMELTDDVWICAAMRAQLIPPANVYIDLKIFFRLLLECPKLPENIRAIVWDTVQILPDAMPSTTINELSITSFGPTAAKVLIGDIDNDDLHSSVEVTNSLGNVIVK